MSSERTVSSEKTKIFGIPVGIDPKILVAVLLVVAGAVYYFNSRDEDRPSSAAAAPAANGSLPPATAALPAARTLAMRRAAGAHSSSRIGLKLVPIDGSRGDVDPTLRLQLLDQVRGVAPAAGLRNVFEAAAPVMPGIPVAPKVMTQLQPPPLQPTAQVNTPPPPPPFSIPLKYYGFAKPNGKAGDANRGLFLDGDSILVGGEGDVLEKRYLIVALTPNQARLEDTQMKQGQDVPVTPAASQ